MALSAKRDDVKQVPWFSLAEWHDVYRQIYSNDTDEQAKAYEALLAWKARIPNLPVGVDCTLSILQVCLLDREWTSKIDSGELPMYREHDLSLMYSTTIMRFLNHISNVGHTKLTSMYKIANELKIPEWIVHLRHEAAHGHELPSLETLRIAINILLRWLHDEYWIVEAQAMERYYMEAADASEEEEEYEELNESFTDLIELWIAVSLYVDIGHELVSDLPEPQLREILQNLRTYMLSHYNSPSVNNDEGDYIIIAEKIIKIDKKYNLKTAQFLLLSEISAHLAENESSIAAFKKSDIFCDVLCKNEAFLPNSDVLQIFQQKEKKTLDMNRKILPPSMLKFWENIILLLHKRGMLEKLVFKLLDIVDKEQERKERRTLAALWISSIVHSFIQLDMVQNISHTVEYKSERAGTNLSTKDLTRRLKKQVHSSHPYLRNVLWLNISSTIPYFFVDINFLLKLLLRVNEFSARLIEPILKLVTPNLDVQTKEHLTNLLKIYAFQKYNDEDSNNNDKIFTIEDFHTSPAVNEMKVHKKKHTVRKETVLADQGARNLHWKPALDTYEWVGCPIGVLPWQDSLKSLESLKLKSSRHPVSVLDSQVVAGKINRKNLKMRSCVKWHNILRGKKKWIDRKRNKSVADFVINRALEIAKRTDIM